MHKTRDLAGSVGACEADASTTSLHTEPTTVRVYERLRRQLGAPDVLRLAESQFFTINSSPNVVLLTAWNCGATPATLERYDLPEDKVHPSIDERPMAGCSRCVPGVRISPPAFLTRD